MDQFVLVPASEYNKSLTTQSVIKQELPKYKAEQPPTYQIVSLNINKKLFGKADPLIDKILSCSRIKLSNSQTTILDGVDTGVLISDFTLHLLEKTQTFQTFTLVFSTFKIGDRVQISKCDLPFRKGYKPQFTREVFEIVAIATRKPPLYTIKDEQGEVIQGKF